MKKDRFNKIRNIINIALALITLYVFSIGSDYVRIKNYGICIIFFLTMIITNLFLILYDKFLSRKRKIKNIIKKCFKYSKKIKVVPISNKNWKYSSYFSKLTDIAKFYAILNEEKEIIEIWLEYNKENEYFIEEIEYIYF